MRLALVAATALTLVTAHTAKADAIDDLAESANVDSTALRGAMNSQPGVDPHDYLIYDGKLPAPAQAVAAYSVWDQIAACESGGNWAANTGNGFYGGLQFDLGSWRAAGGSGMPHHASRATQIAIAESWLAKTSWRSWPYCSRKLGLR